MNNTPCQYTLSIYTPYHHPYQHNLSILVSQPITHPIIPYHHITLQLRQQQLVAQESLLTSAKAQWDEDLLRANASKEEERQAVLTAQLEEHTIAAEAEKARALKLEASKWKQALKEAEKRVELEVKQAKEQGREEREAELRQEQATFEEHLATNYSLAAQAEKEMALQAMETAHKGIPMKYNRSFVVNTTHCLTHTLIHSFTYLLTRSLRSIGAIADGFTQRAG